MGGSTRDIQEARLAALPDDAPPDERAALMADVAWELSLVVPARSKALCEGARELSDAPLVRARLLRNHGYHGMTHGDLDAALRELSEARRMFIALGEADDERTTEDALALSYLYVGAAEVALEHATRGLELARSSGNPRAIGWALHTIGGVHHALRDWDEAERWYRDATPMFEQDGYDVGIARNLSRIADLQLGVGKRREARDTIRRALVLWKSGDVAMGEGHAWLTLAKLESELGDGQAALDAVEQAATLDVDQRSFIIQVDLRRGQALCALGRAEEAVAPIDAALAAARKHGLKEVEADALEARATLQQALGEAPAAVESLRAHYAVRQHLTDEDARARAANLRIAMKVAAERREAEVTERLLLDVLPAAIVRELRLNGRAEPVYHANATVLFTDFVGFTQISATMDPGTLVSQLDQMFRRFDEVTRRFGLEKLKTIGDAYMAVAGVPAPRTDHAIAAALAALHLRQVVRTSEAADGEAPWSVRIGLHTGPLVAGVIGQAKLAYDVWGDTVNTASRMESSGVRDRVNVSSVTHDVIAEYFECEPRGQIQAKGKGAVEMFLVHRLRPEFSADDDGLEPNDAVPRQPS